MARQPGHDALLARVPEGTATYVETLLSGHRVEVRVSRPRRSKLGDHRAPGRGRPHHRISVNENLNPYAFLITLLHEVAHMTTWEKHRLRMRRCRPHGREWKREFGGILAPVVAGGQLPADIAAAVAAFMQNPAAASCTDRDLLVALSHYDREETGRPRLEELPVGAVFRIDNGQVFRMARRLRSRFQCFEQPSGREYRVHGLSRVEWLADGAAGRLQRWPDRDPDGALR